MDKEWAPHILGVNKGGSQGQSSVMENILEHNVGL